MALGTEVGDAYIAIHADTSPFRGDLAKLNRILGNATKKNNEYADSLDRVTGAVKRNAKQNRTHAKSIRDLGDEHRTAARKIDNSRNIFEKFADSVSDRWRRMDSTVRLVLTLILAAGPQMATLGSVLSSSLTAVAAAAAGAVLALAPLLGVIPPLIAGFGLLFTNLDEMKEIFSDFGDAINRQAAGAFDLFNDRLKALLDTILEVLDPAAIEAVVDVFTVALDALNEVLGGHIGAAFKDALTGPLSQALEIIIGALSGPLFGAFLNFVTATAPVALQLAEMFNEWAKGIAKFFEEGRKSGSIQAFFESLLPALQAILDLFGAVKDVLVTLFQAALEPGTQFVNIIVDLLNQWNEWMQSVEGQAALQEWFDNLFAVLPSILELFGAVGTAIADLVTPEAVEATIHLLDALSQVMPILSDVISLLAEAGVIDVLAQALISLGEVITPLIKPFGDLLSAISGELIDVMKQLAPQFEGIGTGLGVLATALVPLIPILGEFIVQLVQGLGPSVEELMPMIADLIGMLIPVISRVLSALAPLIPIVAELAITLINALWPAFEALVPALLRIVDAMAPFVSQLVTSLAPVLTPIIEAVAELVVILLDALMPVFEALLPVILILINTALIPLISFLEVLLPVIVTLLDVALLPLQVIFEILTPLLELLSEAIVIVMNRAIIPITSAIGDWIDQNNFVREGIQKVIEKVKSFADGVSSAKDKVVEAFEKIWDSILFLKDNAGKVFENLSNGIKDSFKGAFNAVARFWNNTVGKLEFTVPDWVPNWGGRTWGVPDIPIAFASGGIANSPTFGVFGEAGTEALVPLDRPLNQVDPSVRWLSAIAQGKLGSSTNNSASVVINTPATDPRLIASILEDSIFDNWR